MKQLLLLSILLSSVISNSQTTHQVCVEDPPSTTCPGKTGTFTPGNLVIQQGDMIEFTTTTVLLGGYTGTYHNIEFTGSSANNVDLFVSSTVFPPSAQVTSITTPPFNTPGVFPMECTNFAHCLLSEYPCTGYTVTVLASCTVNADFTASATDICSGTTVNFTNTSTGAVSYTWKINEFPFSTSTNAVQNFGASGSFDIELIANDGAGCLDSTTVTINVTQAANAGTDESNTFCNVNDSINLNTMVTGDAGGSWNETTSSGQFNNTTGYFNYTGLTAGDYDFDHVILGTGVCPNDTATMTITVNQEPGLTLNVTNTNLATSDSAYIDFTPNGVLPGANWLWNFCDGNFDNPQTPFYYSWGSGGDFCVCVEINNYNGCTQVFCDSSITVWDDAGTNELNALEFNIYPNPADGAFTIDLTKITGKVEIKMYDMAQRLVYTETTSGGGNVFVDAKEMATGRYFIEITAMDQRNTIPVVLK
ncbi:MAG: T9SS type A sorting domain-containing protein [Crocinitomicaceae bacterium]|nr:T9SS type A sorting domain-containing protein [Crocinitomicaceae bacterium]